MTDQQTIDVQLPITFTEFCSNSLNSKFNLKFIFKQEEQKLPTLPEDKEEEEVYGGAHCVNCKVKWNSGGGVWFGINPTAGGGCLWTCYKCWNLNEEQKKQQDKKLESDSDGDKLPDKKEEEKKEQARCHSCEAQRKLEYMHNVDGFWWCKKCYMPCVNKCISCEKSYDNLFLTKIYEGPVLGWKFYCKECGEDTFDTKNAIDDKELECDEKLDSDDEKHICCDCESCSGSSEEEIKRLQSPDSDEFITEIVSKGQYIDFDHSLSATEGTGSYYRNL